MSYVVHVTAIVEGDLEQIEILGFDVTHAYGLTECYGPGVVSEWHPEWDELPTAEKAAKKARQGVPYLVMQESVFSFIMAGC